MRGENKTIKGGRGPRGLDRQARQAIAERRGCPMERGGAENSPGDDKQTRQEPLRLQKPRERGPQAQAGPALAREQTPPLHDSQAVDHLLMRGNTGSGVWADAAYRSEAMEAKLQDQQTQEPHSPQGQARQAADPAGEGQQPDQIHRACPSGTRLWCPGQRHGRHAGAHGRRRARQTQDRDEKPRLQHAPPHPATTAEPRPGVTRGGGGHAAGSTPRPATGGATITRPPPTARGSGITSPSGRRARYPRTKPPENRGALKLDRGLATGGDTL